MKLKSSILKKTVKCIKFVVKYVIPIIIGWLEGNSHAVADSLSNLLNAF